MKRSPVLTAVPAGVFSVILPEPAAGTIRSMSVVVAAVTDPVVVLTTTRLLLIKGAKFVPSTAIVAPVTATIGVKLVIVGASEATTVNAALLVAEPEGVVTDTSPVVAPTGTVTAS